MAEFFRNMTNFAEVNDDQNASKTSNCRCSILNRRHAEEVIMGGSMKSTSGTRAGAGHSIWKEAIQREAAVLRANNV